MQQGDEDEEAAAATAWAHEGRRALLPQGREPGAEGQEQEPLLLPSKRKLQPQPKPNKATDELSL
jgi:hypothetical protein